MGVLQTAAKPSRRGLQHTRLVTVGDVGCPQ